MKQQIVSYENSIEQYIVKQREQQSSVEDTNNKYDLMVEQYAILKSNAEEAEQCTKEEIQRLKDQINELKDDKRIQGIGVKAGAILKTENIELSPLSIDDEDCKVNTIHVQSATKKEYGMLTDVRPEYKSEGHADFCHSEIFNMGQVEKILKMIDTYSIENRIKLHKK